MTETTFLVEWSELKNSEADLIIFRVGNEMIAPTQRLLQKFSAEMKKLFKENKVTIPFVVFPKAEVEVEAVFNKLTLLIEKYQEVHREVMDLLTDLSFENDEARQLKEAIRMLMAFQIQANNKFLEIGDINEETDTKDKTD